jgi:hypothetical protein
MSPLLAFLKLDAHSGLLAGASASAEASPAFHPAAASGDLSGQRIPLRSQPALPDEDSLP